MDAKNEAFHYHIGWQGGALDWEAWSTRSGGGIHCAADSATRRDLRNRRIRRSVHHLCGYTRRTRRKVNYARCAEASSGEEQ